MYSLRLLARPAAPHAARPTNPVSRSDFVAARMALSRTCPRPAPSHPPSPAAFARALCELRAVCQPTHHAAPPMPCACPAVDNTGASRLAVLPYPAPCPCTSIRGVIHRALWSAPRVDPALPAAAAAANMTVPCPAPPLRRGTRLPLQRGDPCYNRSTRAPLGMSP
jgi:hypothetical protein